MLVQVLGTGCAKCQYLEERVQKVVQENNLEIELQKVTEIEEILNFGVMMTPGLVVDGEVKSSGKLPSEEDILGWIQAK